MVWVRVVQTLTEPSSGPKTVGQPGALVWDGRVFTSPSQLKAYLGPKAYARWSVRHPTAFGAPAPVTPKPTARPTTTTATSTTEKPKPVSHPVASPPAVAEPKSRTLTKLALMVLLVLGGLAIGLSAAVPERVAPLAVQRLYADPDRRMIAFAAAAAILLGFAVSFLLG